MCSTIEVIQYRRLFNTYGDREYSGEVQWPLTGQLDDRTLSAGFVMTGLHVARCHSETIQQLKRNVLLTSEVGI